MLSHSVSYLGDAEDLVNILPVMPTAAGAVIEKVLLSLPLIQTSIPKEGHVIGTI